MTRRHITLRHLPVRTLGQRMNVVPLCVGSMALPALVNALGPGLVALPPLRVALIILFNLGYMGLGTVGLVAACRTR